MKLNKFIIKVLLFLLLSPLLFSACKKIMYGVEDGIYEGTYTAVYLDTTVTLPVTVVLTGKEYYCSGSGGYTWYRQAGGSGTYKIKHDKIVFHDEHSYPTDISLSQVLLGEFRYNSKKDKLILTLIGETRVEYNLKRVYK